VPPEVFPKRQIIAHRQVDALRALLRALTPENPFYAAKYDAARTPGKVALLSDFYRGFPFTTKAELVADQAANPPYGTNLTYPLDRYTRCHQTSGTSGVPLRWLDTPESWNWMADNWQQILRVAGVTPSDAVFFAFSFGPFIGFWLAFEAAARLGCRCLPGGGMSSAARLRAILDHRATVLCCTPTYALHLAEVAAAEKLSLADSAVKTIIVAGEPGGSIPATRARLESLWPGVRVVDHHGMTETGPVTFECPVRPRVLHVLESAYVAEIVHPETGEQVATGETGELVLTTLGRLGSPVLRYRTGDLVRAALDTVCECGRSELALEGGILGRTDDMVCVRGVNVYPSAVEDVLRAHGGVAEYQVQVDTTPTLCELTIKVEPLPSVLDTAALTQQLQGALQTSFNLRIPVVAVSAGALPRFEMKAQRWARSGADSSAFVTAAREGEAPAEP
jgi:phenylacetate-CoA ligase